MIVGEVDEKHGTVNGCGQVISGGVLSVTVIVWLHVAELPQSSVAVHVRVTEYSCGQLPGTAAPSTNVSVGDESQASVTVGVGKSGAAGHSTDELGAQVITGAAVSTTVIVCVAVDELPQSSVAVHVRVQTTGQMPAELSMKVSVTVASHVSVADAWAKLGAAGHWIVLGPGSAAITGAVESATLIVCVAVDELPQSSVAVHVRVCTTGQVPVTLVVKVRATVASHVSVADAWAKLGVAGHWIVLGPGSAANTGAVVSATLIVCVAVDELPQSSVAVHVRVCTTGQVPVMLVVKVRVTLVSQVSVADA